MNEMIDKKSLIDVLNHLNEDSCDQRKAKDEKDFYWRCGNANAVNYIIFALGLKNDIL